MKQSTVRYDETVGRMLAEIDSKPTTAAQTVLEIFTHLRRATLNELRGKFSQEEIFALADSFNGLLATWQFMANPSVLVSHFEDANLYESVCDRHGVNYEPLIEKLKQLTAAQATILQLEFIRFWNCEGDGGYGSPSPDLEKLVKFLS